MTEIDLENRLAKWNGAQTADYGAICNDLAQLKLHKGAVAEAQQLFQQALAVTEAAQTQAESSASEDDWESSKLPCLLDCCLAVLGKGYNSTSLMAALRIGWEQNMQHMQQQQKPAPLAVSRRNPKPSAQAQLMQPSASVSRRQDDEGSEDSQEMTIPYDGLHLLECHNMSQYDTELKLEGFLQHLQWSSVAPVVRPVDDTHTVIVCANPADARGLLQSCSEPACKWRLQPFSQACAKSKALKAGELQPPRVRQKTTTAVARRLIGNALHVKGLQDKEAEQGLKSKRADQKEARAEKHRQLQAAWGED